MISCSEYNRLLSGINGDTALGQTVHIRSEKDQKRIREMTNHAKKVRAEWFAFKNKQKTAQDLEKVQDLLKSMFS